MKMSINIVDLPFLCKVSSRPAGWKLFLPTCYQEHNAAQERHGAGDGRKRHIMRYVASSMDRPDINDLLPGRVRITSPRQAEQAQCNQDYPKRFVHGASVGGSQQ